MLKTFTPQQADKALSFVRPVLEHAMKEWTAAAHKTAPSFPMLEHALKDLFNVGCVVRDLNKGTVDFPYVEDGKLMALCWKLGEEAVTHSHPLNDECSERVIGNEVEPHALTN